MRWAIITALLALTACGPAATTAPAAPPAAAPAAGATTPTAWDRDLIALMPQIDACIARSPQTRQVSYAGRHDGAVLIRLQGDEEAIDCRISNNVAETRPRDMQLAIEGERAALFVRGPGENPGGECYVAPEVRDANGALLGWMLDPEGC
jgi:hypothetical protein